MSCPNHNLKKKCKYCTRLGMPFYCKDCGNRARKAKCSKHKKLIRNKKLRNKKL